MKANVVGAGLAGCEAAYQLSKRGIKVNLFEMRPGKMTPAHESGLFAELVCSNSLRASSVENAVGLLKEEMRLLDSLIMKAADYARIPAGGALAVDRRVFSGYVTDALKSNPLVNIVNDEVKEIPAGPTIIASGPLTSDTLGENIQKFFGRDYLSFYDAVAPIIFEESIDKNIVYLKSRYDKGEAAYYNCPMTREEFDRFYEELINAEKVIPRDFEVFEGCMPIEEMAARGRETLLFGPLKPVGLEHPKTGERPYAVVQLRQDDAAKTMYNIVGFQTRLKFSEQKRIIRLIPGLENAEIARYGVMHRNTFINSPFLLNSYYQTLARADLFFAGQITGVEGYVESASSGLAAGINLSRVLVGHPPIDFTPATAIGALANYIAAPNRDFQPMNVNFGIFAPLDRNYKKAERKKMRASRALAKIKAIAGELDE
ncbi:MAG: methylenetetrahydrofolate--tRNA-(uracil(54)-C(5))-methyltransferase (FADH(2)-oxidizing) TrmFO [Bacilli bacterium]|jgi:methylenetetrahydrofolate--tRNA-(uracil-5-)-methyltransferase|nr:methylenetetrahydrofolate--tRNA-(uracil(54)-C(5))-methyltransferase (FADH(2)-oxidizing) TrmFO [Bacilli bacterium]HPZ27161.1 methylenetetrahydrofolate--tRNA-(uracil(54)-C(5))-methyltransferase (FADH(2)-oxidizing) TrmFO [Bacilli bacterium]HQC88857.1 methylenetetrahydrofolate--tRNA-(uracil(54)-C(5))-methyltransferase (FADH(2)-oxidizing) TrmFO [Bacilli bacterium]